MNIRLTLAASTFALAVLGTNAANASVALFVNPDKTSGVGFMGFHTFVENSPGPASLGDRFTDITFSGGTHHSDADDFPGTGGRADFVDIRPDHTQGDPANDAAVLAAVPEPATWAMFLAGFGAIGFAMRRRKQAVLPA
jgi:PEP-CTERM motif